MSLQFHKRTIKGTSPMFNAIHDGDSRAINLIDSLALAIGFSIDDKIDTLNNTALHFATIKDRVNVVEHLLRRFADVNVKNDDGETPLQIAIKTNNIPIAKLLLDNGSDLNQANRLGLTCFFLSIQFSNLEMIQFIIDYGVDIHKLAGINGVPFEPLDFAIRHLRLDVVELLIKQGANVNQPQSDTLLTPLHTISMKRLPVGVWFNETCDHSKTEKVADLLIKAGADLNARCHSGTTPLLIAISVKDFKLVELFVKSGCDLSISLPPSQLSRTPLQLIVTVSGRKKFVELFLRYGANYNQTDDVGFTAYHHALPHHNFATLQVFWQYGCPYDLPVFPYTDMESMFKSTDEHIKDVVQCQKTLFDGIKTNNISIVQKALKLGAVVRGTSMEIKYPLHFVASKGYTHVARLLLENGIIVNNLNDNNETALQLAIKYRKFDMCKLLFQHGAYLHYKKEIQKLHVSEDDLAIQIKDLLLSIHSWFNLVKLGSRYILKLMQDLFESDTDLFLVYLNALDKNKRSLMASAIYYEHGEILEEIMKTRLNYKQKLLGLK